MTYEKNGDSWKLPPAGKIVSDLRVAGGLPLALAQSLVEPNECESLLFAIAELLSLAENKAYSEQWEKLCRLGRAVAAQLGSDRLLQRYAAGDIPKNSTFLYRIVSDIRSASEKPKHELRDEADDMLADLQSLDDENNGEPLSEEAQKILRDLRSLRGGFESEDEE